MRSSTSRMAVSCCDAVSGRRYLEQLYESHILSTFWRDLSPEKNTMKMLFCTSSCVSGSLNGCSMSSCLSRRLPLVARKRVTAKSLKLAVGMHPAMCPRDPAVARPPDSASSRRLRSSAPVPPSPSEGAVKVTPPRACWNQWAAPERTWRCSRSSLRCFRRVAYDAVCCFISFSRSWRRSWSSWREGTGGWRATGPMWIPSSSIRSCT
mmetsp:Transcript_36117/g.84570  ORF Transcript_36117/g.84570 Transcript_36117/m.84570 type:complete len:208 (+) Transcript_36117:1823-2446(+)